MSFVEELKRRNVFRVGVAYVVVAWLIAQVADLVLENISAPPWLMQAILLILALGLPLALIIAWAFELTPEGLKKEKDVDRSQSIAPQTGRKLNALIMATLVLAVAYFAYDKFVSRPGETELVVHSDAPAAVIENTVTDAVPVEKSVAVLPFANRSNRDEDEFFTEGIHDDLLTHLSKIGSMKVISRTSVMRYKGTEKSIPEIAAELKVTTILEGGIQRSGDQVRINVQLIDAKTDEHLWAEIFDRQLTAENLFAIQSEISTKIADALEATLSPEEESRLNDVPTTNMAAYNAFLRGRLLQANRNSADLEQALSEFTRATELDPNYALAWVGLADTYSLLQGYGTLSIKESIAGQELAIEKALAINSELGEAQASLAGLYQFREQNAEAEAAFIRAIELSPNYASAYQWYSNQLSKMPSRYDESLALIRKAAELDPLSSIIQTNFASRLSTVGRYDEAEAQYLRIIELDPDFASAYANLAVFYANQTGRFADAVKWIRLAREKDPGNISLLMQEALFYLQVGDYVSVEAMKDMMADMDSQHFTIGYLDLLENLSKANYAAATENGKWVLPQVESLPYFQSVIAYTFALDGEFSKARETMIQAYPEWEDPEQWGRMIREHMFDACLVAGVFAGSGDTVLAQKLMDQTIDYYNVIEADLERPYTVAPIDCWVARGDHDKALDMLDAQIENSFYAFWWVVYQWPWWDEVRMEPRFQAAMQSIEDKVAVQRQLIDGMNL